MTRAYVAKLETGDKKNPALAVFQRLAARRVLGREYYRPVDASLIPGAQRVAAEHMRRYVRRDLHLRTLKVAWFSASNRPLSAEEWGDPITGLVLNMAVDPWVQQHGRVHGLWPSFVWCRSDLTPYMTARVVAHEAHHARQVLLARKRRYQSTPGPNGPAARASRVAFQRRQREWERDAKAYSRKLAPVAREIS